MQSPTAGVATEAATHKNGVLGRQTCQAAWWTDLPSPLAVLKLACDQSIGPQLSTPNRVDWTKACQCASKDATNARNIHRIAQTFIGTQSYCRVHRQACLGAGAGVESHSNAKLGWDEPSPRIRRPELSTSRRQRWHRSMLIGPTTSLVGVLA